MKKLPLFIDNQIFLRSAEQKAIRTSSKILGARHGDFILIEQPIFRLSERLFATPEEFICVLSHEGELYHFQSKIQKTIGGGLTFIDYPQSFKVETIRKFHRIQVNIDTRITFATVREHLNGTMMDISEGGCFVRVPSLTPLAKNMPCKIDFTLPDNQVIEGLDAALRQVTFYKLKKTMDLGLEFTGPPEILEKIHSFCQFCMFFKV